MGYYSDVKMVTTKAGWQRIKRAVEQACPRQAQYLVSDEFVSSVRGGRYVVFEQSNIKWYNTPNWFAEVYAFEQAMYALEDEGIPYRFMRVGEDYVDVERQEGGDTTDLPQLWLTREIEVEY